MKIVVAMSSVFYRASIRVAYVRGMDGLRCGVLHRYDIILWRYSIRFLFKNHLSSLIHGLFTSSAIRRAAMKFLNFSYNPYSHFSSYRCRRTINVDISCVRLPAKKKCIILLILLVKQRVEYYRFNLSRAQEDGKTLREKEFFFLSRIETPRTFLHLKYLARISSYRSTFRGCPFA